MTPTTLEALLSRIRRTESLVNESAASGFQQSHKLEDGTTHEYTITGIKSPEQLEDELLALFVWVWSLKDYLKEIYKSKQLDTRLVEQRVNQSLALQYVADIANRAKHGSLRDSRSGEFAELVDVGITVPQSSIAKITVGAFSVGVDVIRPDDVELHAFVKPRSGNAIDAFSILDEALNAWDVELAFR